MLCCWLQTDDVNCENKDLHAKDRKRSKPSTPTGILAIVGRLLNSQFCPIRPRIVWAGECVRVQISQSG